MLQPKIANLEQYDSGLAFTLADKLFFLNQLDFNKIDIFVDFGCANGAVDSWLENLIIKPVKNENWLQW